MLKCHPITAFMKTHANFKKIFLIRVFWFKYIFLIKFEIRILDLILLPKNSVPFVGLYYSSHTCHFCHSLVKSFFFRLYKKMKMKIYKKGLE